MFGAITKDILINEYNVEKDKLVVVSIMPCTAKKAEAKRSEFSREGVPDIDIVLTSQELIRMIQEAGIDFKNIEPESMDTPFGMFTGAGVIFGASGGVAEAAVRTAYELVTGKKLEKVTITEARGLDTLKELTLDIEGTKVRMAIINTLSEAEKVLERIKNGEVEYDMIEIMACPGGCIGGAGQPQSCKDTALKLSRAKGLYAADVKLPIHRSHENPQIQELYKNWLKNPNSELAHKLLHTHYKHRRRIEGELEVNSANEEKAVNVSVCMGTCCFLKGSSDTMDELMKTIKEKKLEDKVDVNAVFCFENCGMTPNIAVNGNVITGATPDKVKEIFDKEIAPKLG